MTVTAHDGDKGSPHVGARPVHPERPVHSERSAHWPVDDLGPAKVLFLRLPGGVDAVDAVVVVDNLALGPAVGGVRLGPNVTAAEVARLARAMTLKNAAAGLPHGGGKAGIVAPAGLDAERRERIMRAFAVAIEGLEEYIPGPDMGTDEMAMAFVHDEIGRCVGLPGVLGGIPLDELGATGFGLAVCAEALADAKVLDLHGARVAIQGFGAVGYHAAVALAERDALILAVSDSRGATYHPEGLDLAALGRFKRRNRSVAGFPGGMAMVRDVLGLDCDILVPAAGPDVFTDANAGRVRAKVILQGANIPATPEAEEAFHRQGILCVPDIVANAGGVICAAAERRGGTRTQAFAEIADKIRANTTELLDRMRCLEVTPRHAAQQMALSRITAARSYRRRF